MSTEKIGALVGVGIVLAAIGGVLTYLTYGQGDPTIEPLEQTVWYVFSAYALFLIGLAWFERL